MKRALKWTVRVLVVLVALWAAGVIFQGACLPGLVRSAVRGKLAEMGLPDADLEVRHVSWSSAEFANLKLDGEGTAGIGALGVSYSLASLADGQVETLELTGAEATFSVRDGKLDLGALGRIKTEKKTELPFDRIELRASSVVVNWEGRQIRIPFSAEIVKTGPALVEMAFRADVQGARIELDATFLTDEKSLVFSAKAHGLDIAALMGALPPRVAGPGILAGGRISVEASGDVSEDESAVRLKCSGKDAWLRAQLGGSWAVAEGINWQLDADLADDLLPQKFRCRLDVGEARFREIGARSIRLSLDKVGRDLVVNANADGGEWQLKKLACTVQDLFKQGAGGWAAEMSWELVGRPPKTVTGLLAESGIDISQLGASVVTGSATTKAAVALKGIPPFEVRELRLALKPGDVSAHGGDTLIRGAAADVAISAKGDSDGVRVRVLPESTFSAGEVVLKKRSVHLRPVGQTAAVASVKLDKKGLDAWIPFARTAQDWTVQVHPVTLVLGEADARQGKLARVEAIAGRLSFEGKVKGNAGQLALLPGGWVGFRAARIGDVRVGDARLELLRSGDRPPAEFRFGPAGAHGTIACRVRLRPVSLELGGAEKSGGLAGALLGLDGELSAGRGRVALLPGSWVSFDRVRFGQLRIGRGKANLAARGKGPVAECSFGDGGLKARLACDAALEGPLKVTAPDLAGASVRGVRLSADVRIGDKLEVATARLTVDTVDAKHLGSGVVAALRKLVADAQLRGAGTAASKLEATLGTDGVTFLDRKGEPLLQLDKSVLRPVSASFGLATRKAEFRARWPLQKGVALTADGWCDLSGRLPRGELSARLNGYRLDKDPKLVSAVAKLAAVTVGGSLSLDARLRFGRGGLTPRVTVDIRDGAVSGKKYEVKAEGINGSITLTSFAPVATPGNQRIEIRAVEFGKVRLENGVIALRLEKDPRALFIEHTEWGWAGGRVYSHALRVDPQDKKIDVRLFMDDLRLGALLGKAFGEGTRADGKLYGMLPVTITRTTPPQITFGRGFLYAQPGGGWWRLGGAPAQIARGVLEQTIRSAGGDHREQKQRAQVVAGLLAFKYDMFKIDLLRQKDDLVLRVTARGSSVAGKPRVDYEKVVIDFPHFEKNLRKAIIIKTGLGLATERGRELFDR